MNTRYLRYLRTIPGAIERYGFDREPVAAQEGPQMRLGGITDLIEALGGKVGRTYASELKGAAGMKGCKLFDIDAVVKWREEHRDWKIPPQQRRKLLSLPAATNGRYPSLRSRC